MVHNRVENGKSMFLKYKRVAGPDKKAQLLFGSTIGISQCSPRIAKPINLPSFRDKESKLEQLIGAEKRTLD